MSVFQRPKGLPADVVSVVAGLLTALDQAMPGAVMGFYLLGSLALDDYWPGRSDIDFIAVIAVIAADADVSPLASVHRALAQAWPQVSCDGVYLRSGELGCAPGGVGTAARDGVVTHDSLDERHVVTWLTLLRHGCVIRGRAPSPDWIAGDIDAAVQYSRDNLRRYWSPWLERRRQGDQGLSLASDTAVVWGCLGVARLHAAIVTGQILSKSAAGHHALDHFPDHHDIITEALQLRRGEGSRYPAAAQRADGLIAFMQAVIRAVP